MAGRRTVVLLPLLPSFQAWRRLNRKLHTEHVVTRRRARRAARIEKAVAGMSLEEMKRAAASIKRTVVPGAKEAALKEAKSRREAQQKLAGGAKKAGQGRGAGATGSKAAKRVVQAARPQIRHN